MALGSSATREQEPHRHHAREGGMDQLLRRTAILRPQSRQEFLPRICETHILNLLFHREETEAER